MDDRSHPAWAGPRPPRPPRLQPGDYKALIKVGYGCNEHCTFCHTLDVRPIDGDAEEVERKILRAAELGHSMVVLSGGEPTIRPELLRWAARIADLGLDLGLVTNGRALAYPELTDKLLAHRLRYVYLSLHGGSAPVHNRLVRSDAFDQAVAALRNLAGRDLDLTVNCVVTRQNVAHLRGLVDLVAGFAGVTLKFSMVEPKGGAARNFELLVPRVAAVAEAVVAAAAHARERGVRVQHGGIPRCLVPGLEDSYSDLRSHRYWTMVEIGEPDLFPVDDDNKRHPPACDGCSLRGGCPGLYRGYHEVHGAGELRPVTDRPRANSFNYTLEAVHEAAEGTCPLRQGPLGVTPWERGRHLFVRRGAAIARYRADTRDFTDEEIAAVKHDLGQVYVDAARGPAPQDFARELVPLTRSPLCAGCPHFSACTGMFEPVFEDIFTRDDAAVRARLAALVGDVLDLGCGDAPYLEVLAPRIAAGGIRYTGVDPDEAALTRLRARLPPGATLERGDAEALELGERRFDAVTILRSYNHLRDPDRVLVTALSRLRPGGVLVVCDNTAFGLARTPAQTTRGERSSARREHYRNDDAAAAVRRIEAAAAALDLRLEALERREIGPGTSNQWLLVHCIPT
ncbi:radical SAM protein [Nannocystis bainbridge]|uniref:Radical SAM protein n=1 Tax=Nannocystis bainbridge TaxID=2995303 RepID=A0ABT5E4K3_9BACT|nr:radical SAM protein [Nannocystis bainbridge]MDC0719656.1 radical SAM protein [Nannocystis bainbridge]